MEGVLLTHRGKRLLPANRIPQTDYNTDISSKAQYVISEAYRLQQHAKKLIVYCDWPSNAWLMRSVLIILCMNAACITPSQNPKE